MIGLEVVLIGAGSALVVLLVVARRPWPVSARNHRGERLPVVLGFAVLVASAVALSVVALERGARSGRVVLTGRVVGVSVAIALVFTAGLVDDLAGPGPRGIRGHLDVLREGRLSTGILKIAAAVLGAIVVVVVVPHRAADVRVLGVLLIAGAANVWNGLDVAPGRAAKALLHAGDGVLASGPAWAAAVPLLGMVGAEAPCAVLDVRERAMLGDGGSNALGLAVGAALYTVLPRWGVILSAVAIVGLNAVAETVTFSRVIASVLPLRWLDRLGRPEKFARTE